jgi:hypothetical protein
LKGEVEWIMKVKDMNIYHECMVFPGVDEIFDNHVILCLGNMVYVMRLLLKLNEKLQVRKKLQGISTVEIILLIV